MVCQVIPRAERLNSKLKVAPTHCAALSRRKRPLPAQPITQEERSAASWPAHLPPHISHRDAQFGNMDLPTLLCTLDLSKNLALRIAA